MVYYDVFMLQGHVLRGPGAGGGPEAHDEGVRRLYTRFIMMCLCVTGTCSARAGCRRRT